MVVRSIDKSIGKRDSDSKGLKDSYIPYSAQKSGGIYSKRFDLLSIPILRWIVKQRWYQFFLMSVSLIMFSVIIFAGIFGSQVGNANISIVFVWILWWALLIFLLVPGFGRFWCTICPIPAIGEWIQRGAPISKTQQENTKLNGLKRRWPKKLSSMWFSTFGFLFIAVFSGLITTIPLITGVLLLALIGVAVFTFVVFNKRSFCHYVCPVSGFIGLYSQTGAMEVRIKDAQVCKSHKTKYCFNGSENGYGCPWMQHNKVGAAPPELNTYCGLCMECVKNCSEDNIALNFRPFGADLLKPVHRSIDESYKAFVMLGAALLYSVVLLGTNGNLKTMANFHDIFGMVTYAVFFLTILLVVIPGIFWIASGITYFLISDKSKTISEIFTYYAYAAVPLGLMTWIGFSFLIILPNWAYIVNVINDPFGWGWHLLGIQALEWTPILTGFIPLFIAIAILIGLFLSLLLIRNTSKQMFTSPNDFFKGFSVYSVFFTLFSFLVLYAFVG